MKTILLSIFCILFCFCSSQNQKKENNKHDKLIDILFEEGADYPFSHYSTILLFLKSKDHSQIGYLNVDEIKKIYNAEYNKIDFKEFLIKSINQEITFECSTLNKCFNLNDTIISSYKKEDFQTFLINHNQNINGNAYTTNRYLSENARLTVLYYLFQNGYYSSYDDYIGLFYSRKIDNFPHKEEISLDSLIFEKN